jgi:hypothetical protein
MIEKELFEFLASTSSENYIPCAKTWDQIYKYFKEKGITGSLVYMNLRDLVERGKVIKISADDKFLYAIEGITTYSLQK